jgi:hypothetical protein
LSVVIQDPEEGIITDTHTDTHCPWIREKGGIEILLEENIAWQQQCVYCCMTWAQLSERRTLVVDNSGEYLGTRKRCDVSRDKAVCHLEAVESRICESRDEGRFPRYTNVPSGCIDGGKFLQE